MLFTTELCELSLVMIMIMIMMMISYCADLYTEYNARSSIIRVW